MTPRFCRDGHEVPEGRSFCEFGEEVDESYEPAADQSLADRAEPTPPPDGPAPADVPLTCWKCGASTPDTNPTICLACGKPLTPPRVVLAFPAGDVTLSRGEQVQLGRGRELAHAALCAAYDNVSRKHATVGVDDKSRPWIKDDNSANGTFINDREIKPARSSHPLRDGDRVRLGRDLTATVRVYGASDEP